MADPVFIAVDDGVAGAELVRCLARHGLAAGLVRAGGRSQVEVDSLGEDPRSFFADLGVALAAWSGRSHRSRVRRSGRLGPDRRRLHCARRLGERHGAPFVARCNG